jgi:hypothetical protein
MKNLNEKKSIKTLTKNYLVIYYNHRSWLFLVLMWIIHSDASGSAIGHVLAQQGEDGLIHPIYFGGRILNKAERNYTVS